jgi:ABC transporter ATM
VLKDGQVVEQGTHEELLMKDGLYKSMWVQQSSYGGDEVATSKDGVEVKEVEVVDEKVKA